MISWATYALTAHHVPQPQPATLTCSAQPVKSYKQQSPTRFIEVNTVPQACVRVEIVVVFFRPRTVGNLVLLEEFERSAQAVERSVILQSGVDLPQDTRADRPQEKHLFIMCHTRPHRKIITPPHRKIITPPHRKIIWMTRRTTIVSTWTQLQTHNRRRRSLSEIRASRCWLILARQWTSWTKTSRNGGHIGVPN